MRNAHWRVVDPNRSQEAKAEIAMYQIAYATILAGLTFLVLLKAIWLKVETDDPACTYKLFAARDALIRLSVEGKIQRDNPFFAAMYSNINILLCSSRILSGPTGWPLAKWSGKVFAHHPNSGAKLKNLPAGDLPDVLVPINSVLHVALRHLTDNHFGIFLQINSGRREARKIQKQQAKEFLQLLPET